MIVDNKLNELSSWDEALLSELIVDIDAANFDVELTGFDADEIDALLSPKTVMEDKFNKEKAKQEIEAQGAVTQHGDIWLLGNHRLRCRRDGGFVQGENIRQGQGGSF